MIGTPQSAAQSASPTGCNAASRVGAGQHTSRPPDGQPNLAKAAARGPVSLTDIRGFQSHSPQEKRPGPSTTCAALDLPMYYFFSFPRPMIRARSANERSTPHGSRMTLTPIFHCQRPGPIARPNQHRRDERGAPRARSAPLALGAADEAPEWASRWRHVRCSAGRDEYHSRW